VTLKIIVSYLFVVLVALQSILAIADTHNDNATEMDHALTTTKPISHHEHQHLLANQANLSEGNTHLFSAEIIEITYHLDNDKHDEDQHVECHHSHCHHASAVYLSVSHDEYTSYLQNEKIQLAHLIANSPVISPDLRPPIV
jgi:hypothetical protein